MQQIIEKDGYALDTANSATEAFSLMKKRKYHIVVSDINMPEMDGWELLRELRNRDPLVQVVPMTSEATMLKIMTALEIGAVDFLVKPIEEHELRKVVRMCGAKLNRWNGILRASRSKKPSQDKHGIN